MSRQTTRPTRLAVDALEARDVPATVPTDAVVPAVTVASSETYRPLSFTLQGTLSTDSTTGTGAAATTDNYTGTVTARGAVEYNSPTDGLSGNVIVNGTGRGVTSAGGYTNTFQGSLSFADTNGGWTAVTPYTGTETWTIGRDDAATTVNVGPLSGSGSFDASKYTFTSAWTTTAEDKTTNGKVVANVYQTGIAATDLAISNVSTTVRPDRSIDLHVTLDVTGQLMKTTDTTTSVATTLTGTWESDDASVDAGFTVPVSWNAGKVTADITGLTPPPGATRLILKVDAGNKVAEARENNNTRDIDVLSITTPDKGKGDDGKTDPTKPDAPVPTNFRLAADGTNHVLWLDSQGNTLFRVPVFESSYKGPINLAAGDVTGDGVLDAVVSAGAGGGPRIRMFDGVTGRPLGDLMAYEDDFTGGVNIAVADVTGDKVADVITGTGEGGAPRVRVYDPRAGRFVQDFFAYEDSFRGGVTVATADLNGDHVAEILTGAGAGGAPLIHVFDGKTGVTLVSLFAAPEDSRDGAKVGTKVGAADEIWVTADTGTAGGVKQYRPGATNDGEGYLVLLPGSDWIDVTV